jgi:hypothetical membrane protein
MTTARTPCLRVTSRRHGMLGLASVGLLLVGILATVIPYRGYAGEAYSPLSHFISELGEVAASRLAWLFNLSLVIGGIGLGVFLLLLAGRLAGRYRMALTVVGLLAGASGTLVGVFPMDYHLTHRVVSDVFFVTGWLVAGIFSLRLLTAPSSGFPRWLVAPGTVVASVFLAFIAVYSTYDPVDADARILNRPDIWTVPMLEWASLLSLLAWFVCVSVVLLREADPPT